MQPLLYGYNENIEYGSHYSEKVGQHDLLPGVSGTSAQNSRCTLKRDWRFLGQRSTV